MAEWKPKTIQLYYYNMLNLFNGRGLLTLDTVYSRLYDALDITTLFLCKTHLSSSKKLPLLQDYDTR